MCEANAYTQGRHQQKARATCEDVTGCFCCGRLDSCRGCGRNRLRHNASSNQRKWSVSYRSEQRRNYRAALQYQQLSAKVIQQSKWQNFRSGIALFRRCGSRCQGHAGADRNNSHPQFDQQIVPMTMMHPQPKSRSRKVISRTTHWIRLLLPI